MNAYEKAQSLSLSGTDAEIVAVLQSLTTSDILATKLGKWLGERSLLSWDGDSWFGTLQDLIDAGVITGASLAGIRELKAVLIGPRGDGLATTDPNWAPTVFEVISSIAGVTANAQETIDSFYALDGGRPYKDLTVQDFAAQRTAAETEAAATSARNALFTAFHAYVNAIGTNEQADKKAELLTALEAS
jgi:hypothetical protein